MQTTAELRRMEAGISEHVIRKTRLTVYVIVVVSYNNNVTHACTRVY